MNYIKITTLSSLFFISLQAVGNEIHINDSIDCLRLNEVVVTATRTSRDASTLPLPIKVISKNEIQKTNATKLSEIISQQTGLIVVPDYGYGNGVGIQMQGLDSQYIMIMIDGMPLIGRSAGTLDLDRINVGNVKQIEIIKGASSGLYGSEALGGVVNIITQNPEKGFTGSLDHKFATFNTHDTNMNLDIKNQKLAASIYLNRNSSNGYMLVPSSRLNTVEPYLSYTLNNKLTYHFSKNSELNSNIRYYYQRQNARYNLDDSTQAKGHNFINELESQLKWNNKWNKYLCSEASVYYTTYHTNDFTLSDDNEASSSFFKQMMLRPEIRFVLTPVAKQQVSVGAGYDYETLNRTNFTQKAIYKSEFAYLQLENNLWQRLNILAGIRYDHHNIYGEQWNPKLGVRYRLSHSLSIMSSMGYGFKAPDFRQLYLNFTNTSVGYTVLGSYVAAEGLKEMAAQGLIQSLVNNITGNESLRPESSVNLNMGLQWDPCRKVHVETNLFYNHIKNMIDTRTIAYKTNGQSVFSYYNINKVHTQGIEVNMSWDINRNLQIMGGYQLLYAMDDSAENAFKHGHVYARDSENKTIKLKRSDYFGLSNRSRHIANLKVFYNIPEWKLNLNGRVIYRSKYAMSDTNGNGYIDDKDVFVPGYAVLYVAANKQLTAHLTVSTGADNLLNYTNKSCISNLPGRIIYGKLIFKF